MTEGSLGRSPAVPAPGVRRFSSKWWVVAAGAALLVTWGALAGIRLVEAEREARSAQRMLRMVEQDPHTLEALASEPLDPRYLEVRARFLRAKHELDGALVSPIRFVPLLGRQVRSLEALCGSAASMIETADTLSRETRGALDRYRASGDAPPLLHAMAAAAATGRGALVRLDLGPSGLLVSDLSHARNRLAVRRASLVGSLAKTETIGGALARALEGPRRYVLVAANNAEMRAGSGMFLSTGLLTARAGRLTTQDMRPSYDRNPPAGTAPATGDLRARWGFLLPNRDWRFLALSPRFPASAELATRMWAASGGGEADGVLALDPIALRALLVATGPVTADGVQVDSGNVVRLLLHDQYVRFADRHRRKDFLSSVATAVFRAADTRRLDPIVLMKGLGRTIAHRHLLAWSRDRSDQAAWQAAGMDGRLTPDSLFLSVINRGGNKLDPFLHVDATLAIRPGARGASVVLDVEVANRAPAGAPKPVAGPSRLLDTVAGDYQGIFAVNIPGAARNARIAGVPTLLVAGSDGPTAVLGTETRIPRDREHHFRLTFELPGRHGLLVLEPSARYPPVTWHIRGRAVGDRRREVRW